MTLHNHNIHINIGENFAWKNSRKWKNNRITCNFIGITLILIYFNFTFLMCRYWINVFFKQYCRGGSQASRLYRTSHPLLQASTLSHLENQVACCLALRSSQEYNFWLLTYVRYLVQEGKGSTCILMPLSYLSNILIIYLNFGPKCLFELSWRLFCCI